jgi:hypothetical protein
MNNPKTRDKNLVVQEMENEILLYDLVTNKAFCLNQTSAQIWQLCDGKHTVAEIVESLSGKLNEPITEELIWIALDNFKKDNLLEQNEQFEINFNGLSRRQVIRKIGLASMIAFPLVSSIIAPSGAMAASGGAAFNAACTAPSECQSGNCFNNSTCCTQTTVNGFAPGTRLTGIGGAPTFNDCANLVATNCCSNQVAWFVTGRCVCG